jgi:anthranilate 1,2-dioxygenase small subunit
MTSDSSPRVVPIAGTADVPVAVREAIARLMMEYVHAIDNDEVERWPQFFTDPCLYRIVSRRDYDESRPIGVWYCDSRGMLEDRVSSLREVNVYEPHVYRHVIGPTEIFGCKDGLWHTQTSYLLARTMQDGETQLFSTGRYVDAISLAGGAARFSSRIVVTDSWRYDMLIVIPI